MQPFEIAVSHLLYGTHQRGWTEQQHVQNRYSHRLGEDRVNGMLNDFQYLLSALFADDNRRNREYTQGALLSVPVERPALSNLDRLVNIWHAVMPHRLLTLGDYKLTVSTRDGSRYDAREMSDGERVAIYLIGQTLLAPEDGVLIADEPEIHLSRSIMRPLWDELERVRPDCQFVYITHDLDFAASRATARTIWLKAFHGADRWEWEEVSRGTELPEALRLQVFGSRRPVLFVEGTSGGWDHDVYTALFPDHTVLPRESCEQVIAATKAMAALPSLHHLSIGGIVDRDHRSDEHIEALRQSGLRVADVAEVENLLCLPEAIQAAAERMNQNPAEVLGRAKQTVLKEFAESTERQALARALAAIQFCLNGFGPKVGKITETEFEYSLRHYLSSVDVRNAVKTAREQFRPVLEAGDLRAALRYFNCKGIPAFVAGVMGMKADAYRRLVIGIIRDDPRGVAASRMREAVS